MDQFDYIIVGLGLSGIAFCEQLRKNNKTFLVFDQGDLSASRVSGGVYNPVILKRYTLPWKAESLLDYALPYYKNLETLLKQQLVHPLSVLRLFSSIEDQNNWFEAATRAGLSRFMNRNLVRSGIGGLHLPHHAGSLKETGCIDVPKLLDSYRGYLQQRHALQQQQFDYSGVEIKERNIQYGGIRARQIVFAEGFGIKDNPYFNRLPLVGNKGEYILIKAPELQLTDAVKAQFFIIPQGNQIFKVGATFNWKEKDWNVTEDARQSIETKLKNVLTCDYEVIGQEAGIRPTTGDRRPLLGKHPHHPRLALLNGMGTRGIMMAPYLADMLYNHLEHDEELDPEVNLMRFPKKF